MSAFNKLRTSIRSWLGGNLDTIRRVSINIFYLSIIITVLVMVKIQADISASSEVYNKLTNEIVSTNSYYRKVVLLDTYNNNDIHSKALRDYISKEINKEYNNDIESLHKDMETYLTDNSLDNRLYKVIHKASYDYMSHWFPDRTDIRAIVIMRDKVLFSTKIDDPIRIPGKIDPVLFNKPVNTVLCMERNTGHIKAVNTQEIPEYTNKLAGLSLLSAHYIYDKYDIFGVPDVYPDGSPVNNSKLAVIIAFTPTDSNILQMLQTFDTNIQEAKDYQSYMNLSYNLVYTCILFVIMAVSGIIAYVLDKRVN